MDAKGFIHEHITKMKLIQENILKYIENDENSDAMFQSLILFLRNHKIQENKHILQDFLYLISKISNNHHHLPNFFAKIEQILKIFQDDIKNFFSNFEIFHIFKGNKRILLFLFEEKIVIPDKSIYYIITKGKYKDRNYPEYFLPEFKIFSKDIKFNHTEIFDKNRKSGENERKVCRYIQNDMIDEFIVFVNQTNLPLSATIESNSIFETNSFLLKNKCPSLIEYSAFYGSIRIFKYLMLNKVNLNSSLWLFAIHGQNAEIIHLLEENEVNTLGIGYEKCYIESIKCHHIEIMNYLKENFIQFDKKLNFKFFNYTELLNKINLIDEMNDIDLFYLFCTLNYATLVDFYLNNSDFKSKKIENWKILILIDFFDVLFACLLNKVLILLFNTTVHFEYLIKFYIILFLLHLIFSFLMKF